MSTPPMREEEQFSPRGGEEADGAPQQGDKSKKRKVDGILKKDPTPRKKSARIMWDEENLAHNETHRIATMKITEPKTPYHHGGADSDEEADSADYDEKEEPAREKATLTNKVPETKFANTDHLSQTTAAHSSATKKRKGSKIAFDGGAQTNMPAPRSEWESDSESEEANHSDPNFREKRRQHYNEYKVLQEFRKKSASDSGEAETEDDGDEDSDSDSATAQT